MLSRWFFSGSLVLATVAPLYPARAAAKGPEHPIYLDPEKAGPEFAFQGEYVSAGSTKIGADVVALGDDAFEVVLLPGGLPGDGYDGTGRTELKARRDGQSVSLTPAGGYSGSIANGTLTLKTPNGELSLKKIERKSPTAGARPPAGAVVLFDGTNTDAWQNGKMDGRHLLVDGAETKSKYQNFVLHLEFLLPFKPFGRDQDRGNSGIYIQKRYEVQVLDTFGHPCEFNGCGSVYRQHAPLVNMCYPPLQWQTYDIDFQAPTFDASGKKTKDAVITVKQNGVIIQDHYEIKSKTGAGQPEGTTPGPIYLQDHRNPVFYRNVWIVEK